MDKYNTAPHYRTAFGELFTACTSDCTADALCCTGLEYSSLLNTAAFSWTSYSAAVQQSMITTRARQTQAVHAQLIARRRSHSCSRPRQAGSNSPLLLNYVALAARQRQAAAAAAIRGGRGLVSVRVLGTVIACKSMKKKLLLILAVVTQVPLVSQRVQSERKDTADRPNCMARVCISDPC